MGFNSGFKGLSNKRSWRRNNIYVYSSEIVNITIREKKTLQHQGRWQLEQYVFDAFIPVFLGIDDGDPVECNSLCYEWGGSGVQGSSRRI